MTEILIYIGRLKNCGLGKQKALEFLEKFVDMKIAEQEAMEKMFDNFREDLDEECEDEYRKANCGNCTHGVQITYCKRWKNAFTAGEEACAEWEEVDD